MSPKAKPKPPTTEQVINSAVARHDHARKCKKALDDCAFCQANMKWFGELPPQMLGRVLQDKQV